MANDRLEEFGIYKLASQLFDDFWADSEIVMKDERGQALVKQQTRSLDSVCANIEEVAASTRKCPNTLRLPAVKPERAREDTGE